MNLCNLEEIKGILGRHGFHFSKSLGQNFLIDASVPRNMAEYSCIDGKRVLEIGPGIGCLTNELCLRAERVTAVEIDERLFPVLEETMKDHENLAIVPGDIMKINIAPMLRDTLGDGPYAACANLPYYITTPVLTRLIDTGLFETITVMVQREVALRMAAKPGTEDYGAFTLYIDYHCEPEILFDVPSDSFVPQPKVDSAVVLLKCRKVPSVDGDRDAIFRLVKFAFAQRRKTLVNALISGFGKKTLTREDVEAALESAGIPKMARGETLSLADFAKLAETLKIGEN